MYRNGKEYDKMAQLAISILTDYNITSFPIDEKELCRKMGVSLIPYSEYSEEQQQLFIKRSEDAFYLPPTLQSPPAILYNDQVTPYTRVRHSVFHEIKHYANGDTEETDLDEELAGYFSKYIQAPIPYLIVTGVDSHLTIMSNHGLGEQSAVYVLRNLRNRRAKYGDKIFEYEQPLIDLLFPDIF